MAQNKLKLADTNTNTGTGAFVFQTAPALFLPTIADTSDNTKVVAFSLSGMTTAKTLTFSSSQTTTQTLTIPNITGADTLATLKLNQTFNGIETFSPTLRTSGVASYFTINAPADTGITASTESIGLNVVGATRTWADGTVATQREYYFSAPTYNKTTTAATFTRASTFSVSGAPIAGTGVTITNAYAIDIPGISHFGSQLGGTTQQAVGGTGLDIYDSNNSTGGQTVNVGNTSNGTSAFTGLVLANDMANGSTFTHFSGMFFNSSAYTDTSFGTGFAIANQFAIQNTDGPITISAQNASGYFNIMAGGTAATNEIGRFTTTGQTIGLAGTLTGAITFAGLTSGGIKVQGVSVGGSSVNTLQAVTDTFVYKNTIDVLTNKDLSAASNTFPTNMRIASVGITIDGSGSAISTGSKGYITVPYACTINSVTLLADQSGSIVIDVKKSTYAGFPTTASIAASALPTLSSVQKNTDATLTGWTTAVAAGDVIEFVVNSATTVTRVNLVLKVTKT